MLRDGFRSLDGMHTMPIRHGMTIGEVARRYQQILANPPAGDQELTNALTSIGGPLTNNHALVR